MTSIVALTGLSGVGKSSMLRRVGSSFSFQHLQASALIKSSREDLYRAKVSIDDLRHENIDDSQKLLVHSFSRELDRSMLLAVLDGHTIVECDGGIEIIPAFVFEAVGVEAMIFLTDTPERIAARRTGDGMRNRPVPSTSDLGRFQELARETAKNIAGVLKIPFKVISPTGDSELLALFETITGRK